MIAEVNSTNSESSELNQFSYSIAEFDILLEPTVKSEIVEQRDIFPIPHAPAWCKGMISLRGKLIPVINIHRLFGRPPDKRFRWLLVIETSDLPQAAIPINRLPVQHQVQSDKLLPVDNDKLPLWIKHSAQTNGATIYQADHLELFQLLTLQNQRPQLRKINNPENNHSDSSGTEV